MNNLHQTINIPGTNQILGTGWLPPVVDLRDYTEEKIQIKSFAEKLKIVGKPESLSLPDNVDLRPWCSAIEDQLKLGSCTANAAAGIVEYFENRSFGKMINASRLFIYKTTRNLMGLTGDTGAWLRNTMGALALCGVPPEKFWPYTDNKVSTNSNQRTFDDEPDAFVYSIADNYEALKYFCYDPLMSHINPQTVLSNIKKWLAAGIPSMFGFFIFPSFYCSDFPGAIPYPCDDERPFSGHAIVAVGYKDGLEIINTRDNKKSKGALLIRNSWGASWGDQGYGWLPYKYVLNQYALDFWSVLKMDWVDKEGFGI